VTYSPGWEFSRAHTRTPTSVLAFTNDTFDLNADVVLSPSCELSDAQQTESPRPRTQLYISNDGKTMSFTFDGGCIQFEYQTGQLAESDEGQSLIEGVPFMTRDTLRELSGWTL